MTTTLLSKRGRESFASAYTQGLGLSDSERSFIAFTETNAGKKLLIVALVSYVLVSVLFVLLRHSQPIEERETVSTTIFYIFMMGTMVTLMFGSVFLLPILFNASQRRINAAGSVAQCKLNNKKLSDIGCHRKVANK